MATNTIAHISDESKYKSFDPSGTNFPDNVKDVQTALGSLSVVAVQGVPDATESIAGVIRLSSQQEVNEGILTNTAVSPATLAVRLTRPEATETVLGLTQYATNDEAIAGALDTRTITAKKLKVVIDDVFVKRVSTETANGVIKISTTPAALAGVDDSTSMSPKKVAQAIAAATGALPTYSSASETVIGITRLATIGETIAGTARTGLAVSPFGLANMKSSATSFGIVKGTSLVDVSNGAIDNAYVSPASLLGRTGSTARIGLVKLTTTVNSGDANTALAYNADVIHQRGGQTINGSLVVAGDLRARGQQVVTVDMLSDSVPVGTILQWAGDVNTIPAKYAIADGGSLNTTTNNALFRAIGYKYGGSGATFLKPDIRGLFVRGASVNGGEGEVNRNISDARGNDGAGKPRLGTGVRSERCGVVAAQQIRYHKHAMGWGELDDRGPFGNTNRRGYFGSHSSDSDNRLYYTNEGYEVDTASARSTLNTTGLIGNENRPWNISLFYIIKIQ